VAKRQAETVFSVDLSQYGWCVSEGAKRLGLFVTQKQALNDVKLRRAALTARGLRSTVVVTGDAHMAGKSMPRPFAFTR
jgi:hypothetical protein